MLLTTMHRQLSAPLCIALYITAWASHAHGFTFKDCTLHDPKGNHTKFFCYKKSLDKVPENLPVVVTDIDISYNKIQRIKSVNFQNLTLLETLNISHNHISSVDRGAFRDLINLTELNLNRNYLTKITDELLSGLANLKLLFLEHNANLTIEPSSLSVLTHLECVKLSGNNITNIKSIQPIFKIETLKKIHIASNNISIFQSIDISNSSLKLQELNLSDNPISIFRITTNIFPNLQAIDLSSCFSNQSLEWEVLKTDFFGNVTRLDLTGVHISFADFNVILQTFNKSLAELKLSNVHSVKSLISSACLIPTLTKLILNKNSITSIKGTGLDNCSHLSSLDLSDNNFNIPENVFTSLKNLTNLNLGHNNFFDIPNIIQNMSMLEKLDLTFNRIQRMDCSTFRNLNNLKTLYLYKNYIYEIQDCVFQNLTNLEALYLGSNDIGSLRGAFKNGPVNLISLQLSANSLDSLKADDFRGLKSLTTLDLNDNKIDSIDARAFECVSSLRTLNLRSNKITDKYLTPDVFSGLSNLFELSLQNNHILREKSYKKPPFSNLKSLRVLSVLSQPHHKNKCFLPGNLLWNLTNLTGFWAQNVGYRSLYDVQLFKDNTNLSELGLSGNDLTFLSPDVFSPLRKLYKLYLAECNLKTLDFLLQAKLQNLYYLQISNNQITSINDTIIKALPRLRLLDMQRNTFTCDCTNEGFIKWVKKDNLTQVLAANTFQCNSPPNLKGTKLLNVDVKLKSCSVDIEFYCYIFSMSVVLLTMFTSLLYHFLRWQIVYAYYLFLAFLYDNKKQERKNPCSFQYDAFVSYNIHDEQWVTSELLPKLEGDQGWRLCLHHRDFQPGKFIVDNIMDGIYGSRKTICVISQHYLESEWCSREVQVASFRLFDEKKDVLILVFLEDIPVYRLSPYYRMRSLVKNRTYLSWPKAGEDTRVFWEKLRLALGTPCQNAEEANPLCDVQNVL